MWRAWVRTGDVRDSMEVGWWGMGWWALRIRFILFIWMEAYWLDYILIQWIKFYRLVLLKSVNRWVYRPIKTLIVQYRAFGGNNHDALVRAFMKNSTKLRLWSIMVENQNTDLHLWYYIGSINTNEIVTLCFSNSWGTLIVSRHAIINVHLPVDVVIHERDLNTKESSKEVPSLT